MSIPSYVLFSKTRKVLYIYNKDHTKFWSNYIRNKYPRDKWFVGQDSEIEFMDIVKITPNYKRINLIQPSTDESVRMKQEIEAMKDQLAMQQFMNQETYVVSHVNHGEPITTYAGSDIKAAMVALSKQRLSDSIEVWKNGIFHDTVYSDADLAKYIV
jgi:hypothetical protein